MPTQPKPKTIKRAGWMPKSARYVATDDDGEMWPYKSRPRLIGNAMFSLLIWCGDTVGQPRMTKPPKDPASTLRRIRE